MKIKKALALTMTAVFLIGNMSFSVSAKEQAAKKTYTNNPSPLANHNQIDEFKMDTPVVKAEEYSGWYSSGAYLRWKSIDHAIMYQVYSKEKGQEKFKLYDTILGEELYVYTSTETEFIVRAVSWDYSDNRIVSKFSKEVKVKPLPSKSSSYDDAMDVSCGVESDEDVLYDDCDYEYDECNDYEYVEPEYYNNEEYAAAKESTFKSVKKYPLSTFSADVDTAAYANLRRLIRDNEKIPTSAIRIEEMLNYFDYNYKQPVKDEPFSITTEISDCPWNSKAQLLMIGVQGKDIAEEDLPASNLVFLVDVSGSMYSREKLPLVKESLISLTKTMSKKDKISIVTYAGNERVVLEGARGNQVKCITAIMDLLDADGSTNGESGINMAYNIAEKYFMKNGNNRVIMASDGDLNVGIQSEDALIKLIEKKRETGVYFSILGFGSENIKDNKMKALAANGNGNYNYIDSVTEANKVLVEERRGTLFTIAKDVKLQVQFAATHVKEYRLIGYDYRALENSDFENDKKDAAEIGAGHTVTVLYEIIPADSTAVNSNTIATVNIRYKEPDSDTSKLITKSVTENEYSAAMSKNMKFAAGVAEVGMILKNSEFKGKSTLTSAQKLLKDYKNSDDLYKKEFYELILELKENYSYK